MGRKEKLIRTTVLVTAVIICSKVFGLARDILTAGYFGTSMHNDDYAAAYTLFYVPVLLFNSCITATIVPMFVRVREKYSLKKSNLFASNALSIFCVAAVVIAALMFVFCEPIVRLVYRFDEQGIQLTARLTRIMLLGLCFNVASIVLASLLNAMEHFIVAQLTGFPLSIAVSYAVVRFSDRLGIEAMAWGVFAASVLQVVVLLPALRGWFHYTPMLRFSDKRFHKLLKLAAPAMLSMGVSELNHMVDRSLASDLATGSISSMNYAYKLITFLLGILMVPLTTVMFSRMSKLATANNRKGMKRSLRESVLMLVLVGLPIVTVGMVMARDVVQMIYMRGNFTMESVNRTASVLTYYLIGVMSFGLRDFVNRCFHAIQDTRTPFRVSLVVVATNVVLNLILRRSMGADGLALATSISSFCGLIILFVVLRTRLGRLGFKRIGSQFARLIAAAMLCMVACMLTSMALPRAENTMGAFARLVVTTIAAFGVYIGAGLLMRIDTMRQLIRSAIDRVFRRRRTR